ncbi:hypothetical protein SSX86_013476 [Deinandra increscens subsp. villosa]|uniref:Nodulation signaling pathway 1-like protein n=1 Tax=Deinandra increscens subsp. villosa TaxID=3103831 RepID=A0AAP0D4R7_9ASTR
MIKQDPLFLPTCFPPNQEAMFGDSESGHISDWLEDSVSYIPSFLDDPFVVSDNNVLDDRWWLQPQDLEQQIFSTSTVTSTDTTTTTVSPSDYLVFSDQSKQHLINDLSKKRKAPSTLQVKKPVPRRGQGKPTKDACSNDNRNGRWAEQVLNPCAAAIAAGNVSRVRHLLVVLRELASPTGDANYRLAAYGLQALTHHLSATKHHPVKVEVVQPAVHFSTVKPKFFKETLINFNDINPWFTIPNHVANSSILQVLAEQSANLHILDIGVSHGLQWPTLLEALSRRPSGPPPLVRLTVVTPTPETTIPFANSPPGYNFISNILRSANDYKINLHINRLDNCPLQNLNSQIIKSCPEEILVVCAQFRLHSLNHTNPDNRTEFLKMMRSLEPKGVILNENNMECSCNSCSNFETGFARRVDGLWSFLDSTSVAYKGREMEERKMMEGEASKALMDMCNMNERKEKWVERMMGVGFAGEVFREDVMERGQALLKKYDSNWSLRADNERDGCVSLWWKGQPVSFCSLWKIDPCKN